MIKIIKEMVIRILNKLVNRGTQNFSKELENIGVGKSRLTVLSVQNSLFLY